MKSFIGEVRASTGIPVPNAAITITDHYSGASVTLYEEDETTPIVGLLSDINGRYRFKADDGLFDIAILSETYGITLTETAIPHADGGPLMVLTCGETIAYGKVCYFNAASSAKLAKNNGTDAESKVALVCVTRGSRNNGQTAAFRGACVMGGASTLTPGGTLYLGTAGGVTTTEPANAYPIGQAITSTRFNFFPAGAGSFVETIVEGDHINVDATDPANPIVSVDETGLGKWLAITLTGTDIKALPPGGGDSPAPNNLSALYTLTIPDGYFIDRFVAEVRSAFTGQGGSPVTAMNCTIGTSDMGSNSYGMAPFDVFGAGHAGFRAISGFTMEEVWGVAPCNASFNWYFYFFASSAIGLYLANGGQLVIRYRLNKY